MPAASQAAQRIEQPGREQRVAILAPLAMAHLEVHAIGGALEVRQVQGARFGDAQSGRIDGGEQRARAE